MEDYLKVIFALEREEGRVTTQAIAERLGVQSPSVTNMLKRLAALHLVEHQPYRGVRLTERGRDVALEVIRHGRLGVSPRGISELKGGSHDNRHYGAASDSAGYPKCVGRAP
jgi:DNA-binding MarR family transcriptional regulator